MLINSFLRYYIDEYFSFSWRKFTLLCLLTSTQSLFAQKISEHILLEEVYINSPSERIDGYYGKGEQSIFVVNAGNSEGEAIYINPIVVEKSITIRAFLFYIGRKDKKQVSGTPFEFVVYKKIDDSFVPIQGKVPIIIENYRYNWNKFNLESDYTRAGIILLWYAMDGRAIA